MLVSFQEVTTLQQKNDELKKTVLNLEAQKVEVVQKLQQSNINIPYDLLPYIKLEPQRTPSPSPSQPPTPTPVAISTIPSQYADLSYMHSLTSSSNIMDQPSTSSGIYVSNTSGGPMRRFSTETYRQPPPYRPPPRRCSSGSIPFSRYLREIGHQDIMQEAGRATEEGCISLLESAVMAEDGPVNAYPTTQECQFGEEENIYSLETFDAGSLFCGSESQGGGGYLNDLQQTMQQEYHQPFHDQDHKQDQGQQEKNMCNCTLDENDIRHGEFEMNYELKLMQEFFIPLDDATVPGSDESSRQCPVSPTFY